MADFLRSLTGKLFDGKRGGGMAGRGVVAIAIRFLSAGLGFALVFVMARWMPTDEFGRFGYAFSLAMALAAMLEFGQNRLVLRSLAAYGEQGRIDLMRGVLRFSTAVCGIGMLIGLAGVLLWTLVFDTHPSLLPAAVLTAALILAEFQAHVMRGLGNLVRSLVPKEIAWRPLAILIMAALGGGVTLVTDAATALWVLAATLMALNLLQFLFLVRPRWKAVASKIGNAEGPDTQQQGETLEMARSMWRKSSVRLWLVTAMNVALTPLSVVVVGQFVPPAETGAYFAALRVATVIAFPLQGLNLLASPMLARAYAAGNLPKLQSVASFTATAATALAVIGAVILAAFGGQVLGFMNTNFEAAANLQLVIMAGFVVAAACGSSGQLMNMTGHDREFLKIMLVCNAIGFLLLVYLTANYSAIGTAWGLLAIKSLWNIAVVFWARRNLGVDPSILATFLPPKAIIK